MGLGASPGTPAHQLGALALTQGDPGLLVCPTGGPTGVGGSYGDGACHRALRSPQRVCSDHCLRPQASGPSTQIPLPPAASCAAAHWTVWLDTRPGLRAALHGAYCAVLSPDGGTRLPSPRAPLTTDMDRTGQRPLPGRPPGPATAAEVAPRDL